MRTVQGGVRDVPQLHLKRQESVSREVAPKRWQNVLGPKRKRMSHSQKTDATYCDEYTHRKTGVVRDETLEGKKYPGKVVY